MMAEKKKFRLFPLIFSLYTLLCLVAAGTGLWLLWGFLDQYDRNSPQQIVRSFARQVEAGEYASLLNGGQLQPSRFDDADRMEAWLADNLGGKRISCRPAAGSEKEYLLSADGRDFARVRLEPQGKPNLYGMQPHQVTGVETMVELIPEATITAPAEAAVTVNGVPLEAADGEDAAESGVYTGLPEGYLPPQLVSYRLTGLAGMPEVTARMGEQDCTVNWDGTACTVTSQPDAALQQEITPLAEEASHLYARFITQDATRTALNPYLLAGTEFYGKLAEFYNGWYIDHQSYAFGETVVDGFQQYSPDHLSCDVTFDYHIYRSSRVHDFPSAYTLYFIRTDSGWKVANLAAR